MKLNIGGEEKKEGWKILNIQSGGELGFGPNKNEIDPKYHFLMSAPERDNDGNPTIIRYSRKSKEQYVMTESEGKATGWSATWDGKQWNITEKKKAAPKKATAKKTTTKKTATKKATAKKTAEKKSAE